jgi:Putative transposase
LRRPWRKTLATDALKGRVDGGFRKDPPGLVTNVPQGAVPSPYQSVARSVAPYVVSPPISGRRMERYDGARVTYHDRSHRTERVDQETVEVITWIGRLVQHTRPQGCKRIRSDGVQATTTLAKVKVVIQAALAQVEGVVKDAVKLIARLTYRQRYEQSTGGEPCRCPHGQGTMDVWRLWHPTDGVIDDEGEVSRRGTYASSVPRAGP